MSGPRPCVAAAALPPCGVQPGSNIINVVDRIKLLLPQLRASLPAAVRVSITTDRTSTIRAALRLLEQEAMERDSAVKASTGALQLELDRYKEGTVSYLDVSVSQTIAPANQVSAVQILQRRMTAAVQLILALGGGWRVTSLPTPQDVRKP
jgi:multidrug efflux pump subunit AcrB